MALLSSAIFVIIMLTKQQKKIQIRQDIISAAQGYELLAGKVYLYVFGDQYFEVLFPLDRFLHLTGVDTYLSASNFFKYARQGHLTINQFYFQSHCFDEAKKKLPCVKRLSELTNNLVCVVCNLHTASITYTLGLTNLEFTLGLTEHTRPNGELIDCKYIPRSMRVKDKSIENSANSEFVDFIFQRDATEKTYTKVLYKDTAKVIPEAVRDLIEPEIFAKLYNTKSEIA